MTPLQLRLTGFRTFEQLELVFPRGCVGVIGDNGAGKSSLVIAIETALFGSSARSLEPFLTAGAEHLEIQLELDHAGERYRVRRSYKNRKATLDFERWLDVPEHSGDDRGPSWAPLTLASAAETQTRIEDTLGLTRETYRASAYLAQGDGAAFTAAQPRDRKRILADALGLNLWDRLLEQCRRDKRDLEQREQATTARLQILEEQAGALDDAEREVPRLRSTLETAEQLVVTCQTRIETIAIQLEAAERAGDRLRALTATVQATEARATAHRKIAVEAQVARERRDSVKTELAAAAALAHEHANVTMAVQALDLAERERGDALRERQRLTAETSRISLQVTDRNIELQVLDAKLAAIDEQDVPVCDRCSQELHGAARAQAKASLQADREGLQDTLQTLAAALGDLNGKLAAIVVADVPESAAATRARLEDLREAPARLAVLNERLTGLDATIAAAETPEYQGELARFEQDLADATKALADEPPAVASADQIRADLQKARTEARALTETRDRCRDHLSRAEITLERAQEALAQARTLHQERAAVTAELDELFHLERAYGRDGVPAHIVENVALPAIERQGNEILEHLGGPVSRVELRTERALKSGDGTRDTLDVICVTDAGERDYSTFSGGEQTRIELALRIAFARLLAHRRGAESRLLAIDEPEGLDEPGMAALVDVLRGLEQAGEFDCLMLVSHIPALRDAFDTTLNVVRDGDRSQVVAA